MAFVQWENFVSLKATNELKMVCLSGIKKKIVSICATNVSSKTE